LPDNSRIPENACAVGYGENVVGGPPEVNIRDVLF